MRPEKLRSDRACRPRCGHRGSPSGKARWDRKENPRHDWQSLSPVRWEGKSHGVIIPQYRTRVCYGKLRRQLGGSLRALYRHRGGEVGEGHGLPAQVHLCLRIPPKYREASTLGLRKGQRAGRMQRELRPERRMTGLPLWAAGYWGSPVGVDETPVRHYLREQEEREQRHGE